MIIGDSYAGGFSALLAKEINLPLLRLAAAGQTTQAIKDMVPVLRCCAAEGR